MRDKFFTWLAAVTYRRYLTVFSICLLITILMGFFASKLRMDMTWNALVPDNHPAKDTFQSVLDEFGVATQIVVALEGDNKDRLIRAAEELAPLLRDVSMEIPVEGADGEYESHPVVKRVDVQYDTGYVAQHGLMLQKARDLRNSRVIYTDYNLVPFLTHVNDLLESEYVQNSDNLTKQEKEAVRSLDGLYTFAESIGEYAGSPGDHPGVVQNAADALTIGDGYFLSTDKKMLLIFVTPTMSLNDPFDITTIGVNAIDKTVQEFAAQNPGIRIGLTGGHVISRDEMEAGMEDTIRNVTIAFIIILTVFIISFRMFTAPLLAMLVLIAGIVWDMGIASLIIGRLNLFTAMCGVVLVGLGVDFAIHIISAFTEFRHKGEDIEEALRSTFTRIGGGLTTGAVTTAFAFLALTLTSYPAFREFGFVVGAGILCCLLASLFLLPAVIVMKERFWKRIRGAREPKQVDMTFAFLGAVTEKTTKRPWLVVITAAALTLAAAFFAGSVYMNQNYMDMEPEGLESVRLQREIPKRFNMSADNMVAVAHSLEESSRLTAQLNERPAIGFVESISDYLPSPDEQAERIPLVADIAHMQRQLPAFRNVDTNPLIEQLYRFSDNLTEMSSLAFISGLDKVFDKTNHFLGLNEEGDQVAENRVMEIIGLIENNSRAESRLNSYQRRFKPAMTRRIEAMANPREITLNMVPAHIREKFISNDEQQYLIMLYSRKDIWDGLLTSPFLETVLQDVPDASGMPVLMKAMVTTAKEQGLMAFLYAFIAFFIILMADFKNVKITIVATIPLLVSLVWMLGIMGMTGFPFSIVNVIGLPLILGIGIDDGVHIIHRYRIEGRQMLPYTISSIGKAIFLTTLTTMLGFGSLIPSSYRGYASLGTLVALGIGICFLVSVFVLPPIMKLLWGGSKDSPVFFRKTG
ncbi:RND family transporter [candidate division KSB1 bacterium]